MSDCQHNRLEAEAIGCHVTDGNPDRWVGYAVRVRVRCHDCHAPFSYKGFFVPEADRERPGGEWVEARLVAGTPERVPQKTASVTGSVVDLDPTGPGRGTLARPEIASALLDGRERVS